MREQSSVEEPEKSATNSCDTTIQVAYAHFALWFLVTISLKI